MTESTAAVIQTEGLRQFAIRALQSVGVAHEDAEVTADSMILANLRGEGDHGLRLVATWIRKIKEGGMDPRTPVEVIRDGVATAVVDAHRGIGAVAATYAMNLAMRKAQAVGVGWVGVRNSNSFGNAKYYAMLALQRKMIGIVISNTPPILPPPGGLMPKTGTNPVAIAVPAKDRFPVVLDMSTGIVALERLRLYASRSEKIPPGWAIDRQGNTLEDPRMLDSGGFLQGGFPLPVGGYKGFGLSVMFNLLTGVLLGGLFTDGIREFAPYDESEGVSFVMGAVKIEDFMPYEQFVERVDAFVDYIKDCKLEPGVQQVYLPGERGFLREKERCKSGIPLDPSTLAALQSLARELGIPGVAAQI